MRSSIFILMAGLATVFVGTVFVGTQPAAAHNFELTDVLVVFKTGGTYQVDMTVDLDALALGASPTADSAELAGRLWAMEPDELDAAVERLRRTFERRVRVRFDEEPTAFSVAFPDHGTALADETDPPTVLGTTARLEGRVPEGARAFSLRASRAFPPVHLTILHQGHAADRQLVERGVPSSPWLLDETPAPPERSATAGRYLVLGFWHIVPKGLDHILFVLGLFLLARRLKPLLWQVSAFTAAHTATLALSTYGVVVLPSGVVEPLIALSIAYVAVENVFTEDLKPWRVWLVFAFGLLHGLGFAGVLAELGLPPGELVTALLSFNAGVELGQLAVILVALAALGVFRDRPWYRRRLVVPLSLAIAAIGAYWAVERTFFG